ncbi:collagen, type V, alpha 3b precursor [Silurus meridionalis]|nr:collagen, type V, alpha 3b precursor [Silurus meridionalis]
MATVRAQRGAQCFLLSVYDSEGVQQLGLELGRSPVFLYEDHEGQPSPDLYPVFKKVNVADGKWHRLAYSVEGKKVTLYLDCEKVTTLDLPRGDEPRISTEGVTVFGRRLLEEEVFEVQKVPRKPAVEEYDDLYSDLYSDLSVSTVTASPNITEFEFVEYEDLDNRTESVLRDYEEYEEYEEYEDRYGPAIRYEDELLNRQGLPAGDYDHYARGRKRRHDFQMEEETGGVIDGQKEEEEHKDGMQSDGTGEEEKDMEDVFGSLVTMRTEVEGLRIPKGTYHSPARTCKELWMCHTDLPDGVYWIDPNQGCHRDAFKVFCNFTAEGETCLQPHSKHQATRSGQDRTELTLDFPNTDTLPILDVAVSDFGNSKQKFGFSVGPVCFNG